ncbi:hypothetical protein [Variovorax sp. JS1663]|uniref:hypothetical protein n=1 Tax=Variovorax sp. JS1663 TaxID=1851577 RepID=UPI00117FA0E8|nr:hypothetical protein [Variovorax sp. JS1663]
MHLLHIIRLSKLPLCVTDLEDIEKIAALLEARLITATLPRWRENCRATWATVHSVTPLGLRELGRLQPFHAANSDL